MPRLRLWLWIAMALVVLLLVGLVLQGVNQLLWQLSYWLPGWLVGPLLLLVVGAVVLALGQLGWPWIQALLRGEGHPKRLPAEQARNRREAAARNLQAIDQTLEQVRDAVERQALQQERERMQAELERGDVVIAVFGTGSTGKTSLIRALLQELVGTVGAAMGSTRSVSRYRLRLQGLSRAVILEDTPGILEAGEAGGAREETARRQAAKADLLLLVVDGDLRAAEWEVFETLASVGKRLLLVLNKCDLRGEQEEQRLLALLRRRCADRIAKEDVVPVSSAPQSVPMPGGRPYQPAPEVEALVRRMAAVLHAEGEELIADNLLLQCRELGEASRQLLDRQRRQDAERIVDRYMWIGAGVLMVTPLPGVDLLGTAAVNAQMVMEIGKVYGVQLSRASAQDLALSVGRTLAGLGLIKGGVGLLTSAMALQLPVLLVGRAIQAVSAAWLTRVAGQGFISYFQQNQDWGDGGVQEVLQRQFDLNRREGALRQFLELALQRVVEPLQRQGLQLPPQPGPRSRKPQAVEDEGDRNGREEGPSADRAGRSRSKPPR
ncbi:MAG: YcjF family protein [Cyanobium sp.]